VEEREAAEVGRVIVPGLSSMPEAGVSGMRL
jgi:hypothetical protein